MSPAGLSHDAGRAASDDTFDVTTRPASRAGPSSPRSASELAGADS